MKTGLYAALVIIGAILMGLAVVVVSVMVYTY